MGDLQIQPYGSLAGEDYVIPFTGKGEGFGDIVGKVGELGGWSIYTVNLFYINFFHWFCALIALP
ncbi:MAG: hypothetical protein A4E57_03357 [Syntrophorhabdaceae bacterium PtaU1.Bin034]|nr:MAG: hypothetical protein A4E57_03357 [Syntrophorhabdaceae bacterium PtaU1.Bin034]